ncbi:MAG: hypothetical protein WC812_02105 [Candidatus Pacearchaeota archaeon]|jgi:hypothetical protein
MTNEYKNADIEGKSKINKKALELVAQTDQVFQMVFKNPILWQSHLHEPIYTDGKHINTFMFDIENDLMKIYGVNGTYDIYTEQSVSPEVKKFIDNMKFIRGNSDKFTF